MGFRAAANPGIRARRKKRKTATVYSFEKP
jgi:hypothetical protein